MNDIEQSHQNIPGNEYKPSEIIGIFNSILSRQSVNAQIVYLRGIYLANPKAGTWSFCYDTLRDEDSQEEITIKLTPQQRENLKNGNLVRVGGLLNRSVSSKGYIQLILNVSRIDIVQEQAYDENEVKRIELRQKKASAGFKNVDSILEQMLFTDQRPRIALLFAETSITMSDFEAGINAAKSAIDFEEFRVSFSKTNELTDLLKSLDQRKFTVISMIRGGGSGIEKLDEIAVLETIVNLDTPIIGAIGHVDEKLFIKQLVDKCAPTPNGLGQYFSEMVERVSEKKNKSRAALTEQIKKQFKEQIETAQKQNKELQDKLTSLTKLQEESNKKQHEQVNAANAQNKALQEQLAVIQKSHKEQIEKLNESQSKLQTQLKNQLEDANKRTIEMNKNISDFQKSNNELQKNLNQVSSQNTEYLKQLGLAKEHTKELENQLSQTGKGESTIWKYAAIIAITLLFLVLFLK